MVVLTGIRKKIVNVPWFSRVHSAQGWAGRFGKESRYDYSK